MGVTAILVATGRIDRLNESIASFLEQDLAEKQLIVFSTCFRQSLSGEFPNVTFINARVMTMPMQAKNLAVENAMYPTIVLWSEMDYYLLGHLSRVAKHMAGRDWCWFEREFQSDHRKHLRIEQGSESVFAFTREAWQKCGKFQPGINGFDDRNFIARVTKDCVGQKIPTSQLEITFIRLGSDEARIACRPTIKSGPIKVAPLLQRDYRSQIYQFLSGKIEHKIAVILLGRYGDIICLLPFLKLIADNYEIPYLVVSQEFADLLEGVSYAKSWPLPIKNEEAATALAMAKEEFQIVINGTVWGRGHSQKRTTSSYNKEIWANCGIINRWDDKSLKPVFDRRDPEREALLLRVARKDDGIDQPDMRPMILVNVSKGISSPCAHCGSLLEEIKKLWGMDYNIVDLSQIRAHRLYDFLVLMENAVCLVSLDTSFIHLSAATNVPVVALLNPLPWASTEVRGNLIARMTYDEVKESTAMVHEGIAAALACGSPMAQVPQQSKMKPINRRIFHCVERHDDTDRNTINRKKICWDSWDAIYEKGGMIPCHFWSPYNRDAREIGEARELPYLKDVWKNAMDQMEDEDIMCWSNDDNWLHSQLPDMLRFHVGTYGCCTSFRSEFMGQIPSGETPPHYFDIGAMKHMGRDIFAATKVWLLEHWDEIPDFILGCSDFDLMLACMVRLQLGIKSTAQNIQEPIFPAETLRGYVAHQHHQSHWSRPGYQDVAAGQKHNRKLFADWARVSLPDLKFNENNTLA